MARVVYQGNGTTFASGGSSFIPKTITVPGWEKKEGDSTDLSNASVMTKFVGKLKEYGKLSCKGCSFTGASVAAIPENNALWVVTFGDSAGTFTAWMQASKVSDIEVSTEAKDLTFDVDFTITNRNGSGVETAPVFA